MENHPVTASDIRKISAQDGSIRLMLRIDADEVTLVRLDGGGMIRFTCPPDFPALTEKLHAVCQLPLAGADDGGCTQHEITLADGTCRYAPRTDLFQILDELECAVSSESGETVKVDISEMQPLAGAVAYQPPMMPPPGLQNVFPNPGMMNAPMLQNPPAAPQKFAVVSTDGTWDCACGTKGLTSKFCYECGAAKPAEWTCSCGSVNTGRFCPECGQPKPEP